MSNENIEYNNIRISIKILPSESFSSSCSGSETEELQGEMVGAHYNSEIIANIAQFDAIARFSFRMNELPSLKCFRGRFLPTREACQALNHLASLLEQIQYFANGIAPTNRGHALPQLPFPHDKQKKSIGAEWPLGTPHVCGRYIPGEPIGTICDPNP